jgi:hypothetical protein
MVVQQARQDAAIAHGELLMWLLAPATRTVLPSTQS